MLEAELLTWRFGETLSFCQLVPVASRFRPYTDAHFNLEAIAVLYRLDANRQVDTRTLIHTISKHKEMNGET